MAFYGYSFHRIFFSPNFQSPSPGFVVYARSPSVKLILSALKGRKCCPRTPELYDRKFN